MSSGVVRWAAAAALLASPGLAAHAGGYGYNGYGYGYGGYGASGYSSAYAYGGHGARYGRYGYGYQPVGGYGDGGYGGYGGYPYGGYGYGGHGYGGYGYGGYGYGAYGYGSSPLSLPAHYCAEHEAYHQHEARMNDTAPYNDWWGAGGPWGWHEEMEADHARFHYSHPGSWRCVYQGWPN